MSPLNRGAPIGMRMPMGGMRPPPPRFGGRLPLPPGMPPRLPPPPPLFGPMRQRMMHPRAGPMIRPVGPPPLFSPRGARGVPPLVPPIMGPRGPRGPLMRPGPRVPLPPPPLPQGLHRMRPRMPMGNGNSQKMKSPNAAKKAIKLEELELKKPWMTDEIRNEIQKKNKLYAKAKKNKDSKTTNSKEAKEWEEFKDLRNKVTRMIRDAKNEYFAKNPEQQALYPETEENDDHEDENFSTEEDEEDDEDTSYYCEICDRDFFNAQLLKNHIATHKICGIDGCTFTAHPKLVEKHIDMQHCTGLYTRMKNLSTPEDIKKWIEERKKKYPTKVNVERGIVEQREKQERGEIIRSDNRISRSEHRPAGREKRRRNRKRKNHQIIEQSEPIVELYRGLRPFAGTGNLEKTLAEKEEEPCESVESEALVATSLISDDEDELPVEKEESPPIKEPNRLASLVADYDSDSDGAPEEVPAKKIKMNFPLENESSGMPSPVNSTDDSQKPMKIQSKVIDRKNPAKNKNPANSSEKKEKSIMEKVEAQPRNNYPNKKRLQLLQRLLSRSITHERNLICQCIKHIADNNFFMDSS